MCKVIERIWMIGTARRQWWEAKRFLMVPDCIIKITCLAQLLEAIGSSSSKVTETHGMIGVALRAVFE